MGILRQCLIEWRSKFDAAALDVEPARPEDGVTATIAESLEQHAASTTRELKRCTGLEGEPL